MPWESWRFFVQNGGSKRLRARFFDHFVTIFVFCVFVVLISLIMRGPDGQTLTPNWSRNAWKLISELGRKWSLGGHKGIPECWFVILNQNHIVPAGTCLSAKIMILCKDHHPLPTSWSSARIMILCQQHDSPSKSLPGAPSQIECFYGHKIDMLIWIHRNYS